MIWVLQLVQVNYQVVITIMQVAVVVVRLVVQKVLVD
jgi:hypothetical protein